VKFEAGLHDFSDFALLPSAEYEFVIKEPLEVTELKGQKTDISGKEYTFVLWAEVTVGEYAGKKVRRQFSNRSKGARYFMKSFMERLGISITKDGAFNSEDFLGRRFKATVGERAYTDQQGQEKKANDLDTESTIAL